VGNPRGRFVLASVLKKGGSLACLQLGAKPTDHRPQRRVPIPELFGDLRQRTLFHEERPECFVVTVKRLDRFKKETTAGAVIFHDWASKVLIHFFRVYRPIG
jgi:hypothetical protein